MKIVVLSWKQKNVSMKNISCPRGNIEGNNVTRTIFPCLWGPLNSLTKSYPAVRMGFSNTLIISSRVMFSWLLALDSRFLPGQTNIGRKLPLQHLGSYLE